MSRKVSKEFSGLLPGADVIELVGSFVLFLRPKQHPSQMTTRYLYTYMYVYIVYIYICKHIQIYIPVCRREAKSEARKLDPKHT